MMEKILEHNLETTTVTVKEKYKWTNWSTGRQIETNHEDETRGKAIWHNSRDQYFEA